jgi:hypothetical protein
MQLLDTILNKKARLFDYECITEDGKDNQPRLVAFGKYGSYNLLFECLNLIEAMTF